MLCESVWASEPESLLSLQVSAGKEAWAPPASGAPGWGRRGSAFGELLAQTGVCVWGGGELGLNEELEQLGL